MRGPAFLAKNLQRSLAELAVIIVIFTIEGLTQGLNSDRHFSCSSSIYNIYLFENIHLYLSLTNAVSTKIIIVKPVDTSSIQNPVLPPVKSICYSDKTNISYTTGATVMM